MKKAKQPVPRHEPLVGLVRAGVQIQNLNQALERRHGLSLVQWCVLTRLIDMPATSARKLASAVGIHPSTLTASLGRLQRKGYLFSGRDPRDGRKKVLGATRAGKEAADALAAELSKLQTDPALALALGRLEDFLLSSMRLIK